MIGEDVIGLSRVADDMRWRRKNLFWDRCVAFVRTVHRKIKRASQTPEILHHQPSFTSRPSAGRPVSNAVNASERGTMSLYTVYVSGCGVCKWLIIYNSACTCIVISGSRNYACPSPRKVQYNTVL
ncbi:hypothetical protein BGY98DRAFT_160097 [Russula aff. rugulosa BPL654]|nr:hypothetical protein BGY98DRAFT_160097 [Russula aff. rugulosa BPL654]